MNHQVSNIGSIAASRIGLFNLVVEGVPQKSQLHVSNNLWESDTTVMRQGCRHQVKRK